MKGSFIKARRPTAEYQTVNDLADYLQQAGYRTLLKGKTLVVVTDRAVYVFFEKEKGLKYRRILPEVEFGCYNGGADLKPWLILWTTVEESAPKRFMARLRILVDEETVRLWTHTHSIAGCGMFPPPIAVRKHTISGVIETDGRDMGIQRIDQAHSWIGDTELADEWRSFDITTATYVEHETGGGHTIRFHRLSHGDAHMLGLSRKDWWELVRVLRRRTPLSSPSLLSVVGGRPNAPTGRCS